MPTKDKSKHADIYKKLEAEHRLEITFKTLTAVQYPSQNGLRFQEVFSTMAALRAWAKRSNRIIRQKWDGVNNTLTVELES